jgi:hypothetical protein
MSASQLARLVADTALEHYHRLPSGWGKPQPQREWTVYCAIVATQADMNNAANTHAWVVSCATGTKCTSLSAAVQDLPKSPETGSGYKGRIVKDCHAEVLTRRGFMRVLWAEIIHFIQHYTPIQTCLSSHSSTDTMPQDRSLLSAHVDHSSQVHGDHPILHFQIKPGIQLHLYMSDSPCGDASIYPLDDRYRPECTSAATDLENTYGTLNFTGAKLILPPCHRQDTSTLSILQPVHSRDTHTIARENQTQILSALRLKSCRSNIPEMLRTKSLSCSDKIVRWTILGLQGSGPLTAFIPHPIQLASIVVSQDPRCSLYSCQLNALQRSIISRAHEANLIMGRTIDPNSSSLPQLFIVSSTFPWGKAISDRIKMDSTLLPTSQGIHGHETKKRKLNNKTSTSVFSRDSLSPSGLCFNWQNDSTTAHVFDKKSVEVLVGAKGIVQGKYPRTEQDVVRCTSRLSRWVFLQTIIHAIEALFKTNLVLTHPMTIPLDYSSISYQQLKHTFSSQKSRENRQMVLFDQEGPLGGWLTTEDDDDFTTDIS